MWSDANANPMTPYPENLFSFPGGSLVPNSKDAESDFGLDIPPLQTKATVTGHLH